MPAVSSTEYTFNSKLGFAYLNQALNSDEVLAVAFNIPTNGCVYPSWWFSSSITSRCFNFKIIKVATTDVCNPYRADDEKCLD